MKGQSVFKALYKPMNSTKETDQKSTILGLLTLLLYEFDKMEFLDNQLFTHALKQSASGFKKLLDKSFADYYRSKSPEEVDLQMNTLNDLCQVIERNIIIAYQLGELPVEQSEAFIVEYVELLRKFNLGEKPLR